MHRHVLTLVYLVDRTRATVVRWRHDVDVVTTLDEARGKAGDETCGSVDLRRESVSAEKYAKSRLLLVGRASRGCYHGEGFSFFWGSSWNARARQQCWALPYNLAH